MESTPRCRCGRELPPRRGGSVPRKWCSESCRVSSYRPPKGREARSCGVCGVVVEMAGRQLYCSRSCGWRAAKMKRRKPQDFVCGDCGAEFSREPVRGQRPKWCLSCRKVRGRQAPIPKAVRLEVYERDGWVCQICFEGVERDAPPRSAWSPSLDHVVCQSWAEVPDHSADNLRLAHHWCNSVRSDERAYSDEDLAGV